MNEENIKNDETKQNPEDNLNVETEVNNQEDNENVDGQEEAKNDGQHEESELPKEEMDPLEAANRQIEELKDKYLRSVAEFDNYRKRTLKEKTELILNGGEKAITAILPIIDDLERAIANGEKTNDIQAIKEGVVLIHNKFLKTMEGLGVKQIDTTDADFNTDVHEAIAMVPGMGDDKKGKVLDCVQTGYMMNDKVIRHAKVAVGQ